MQRRNTPTYLYALQMRDLTSDLEELDISFSIIGFGGQTNSGLMIWVFKEWGDRDRSQAELQQDIQARISQVAGVEAFVFVPPTLPRSGGGMPISVVLQSTSSADLVYELAEEIRQEAQASGQFIVVQNSLSFDARQVKVTIGRARASALNLSALSLVNDLSAGQDNGRRTGRLECSRYGTPDAATESSIVVSRRSKCDHKGSGTRADSR